MVRGWWSFFVFCLCLTVAEAGCSKCPPPGFDSVKNFKPDKFIEHSWYVQEQTLVAFQPISTFYCTLATYEPKDKDDILKGLIVYNYSNRDKVNGAAVGTSGSGGSSGLFSNLEAAIPNPKEPSKLLVGQSAFRPFVPLGALGFFYGEYWVVAVAEDDDGGYQWAIASGGAPEVSTDKGCRTGFDWKRPYLFSGVGLWFFSRRPVDPAATKEMRSVARNLGFDISNLYPVEQKGCKYKDAVLK